MPISNTSSAVSSAEKHTQAARSPWGVFYFLLLLVSALMTWFSQQSINRYWQQTYHSDSLLQHLEEYEWWRKGAELNQWLNEEYRRYRTWLGEQDRAWAASNKAQTSVQSVPNSRENRAPLPQRLSQNLGQAVGLPDFSAPAPTTPGYPPSISENALKLLEETTAGEPSGLLGSPVSLTHHLNENGEQDTPQASENIAPAEEEEPQTNAKTIILSSAVSREPLHIAQDLPSQFSMTIPAKITLAPNRVEATAPNDISQSVQSETEPEQKHQTSTEEKTAEENQAAGLEAASATEMVVETEQIAQNTDTPNTLNLSAEKSEQELGFVYLSPQDQVFFAGDSLMQGVAPLVQKRLSTRKIASINLSKQSTGLTYPSFFDWPGTIEQTLQENPRIKLLVMFLGANDPWDLLDPEKSQHRYIRFKSEEWESIYRQRIQRVLNAAQARGVRVIWLGPPYMRQKKLNDQMRYLNGVYQSQLANHAIWLPTHLLLSNNAENYKDSIIWKGKNAKVRSKDGIHFSRAGQEILAEYILEYIRYRE